MTEPMTLEDIQILRKIWEPDTNLLRDAAYGEGATPAWHLVNRLLDEITWLQEARDKSAVRIEKLIRLFRDESTDPQDFVEDSFGGLSYSFLQEEKP